MDGIVIYYLSMFIMSVILAGVYVFLWHKHFNVFFSLIFAFIPIVNLGHYLKATAKTLEEVIIAQKIIYLGGCFLILFISLYILQNCNIKVPRFASTTMIIISMGVYGFVLTIGQGEWFYKSITAEIQGDTLVVTKEYGPIHTVFYAMTFIYFIIGFSAIIYSYIKKNDVSRKIISLLFVPELVSVICFFFGKQITTTVELIPSCFVLAQIMYLFIAHYTCIYNVSDMAIDSLVQTGATGFVSFDFKLNYLGSNEMARSVFGCISDLTVDRPLERSKELSDLFGPWIKRFSEDESDDKFYYNKGDNIYLVDINHLFHASKKIGYQMIITDDTKNQKYIELIDNYNSDLEKEVQQKTENLVKMHSNLIRSMAKLVESRDNSTGGHIIRTSDVVEILMDEIMQDKEFVKKNHIDENFKKNIIKAAPLHDIGKIAVDDDILKKPGRFTDEEFEKMKAHAPEGAKVLHSILADTDDEEFKVLAENVAHYHHERMDGSGYPDGLVGEQIPIESRIMAIADVYDALVSKRVYKDKMSFEKADSIMMESMGKHFDKELEKFYVSARSKIEEYYLAAGE